MLITVGKHSKMPDTGAIFIDPGLTALDSEHRIAPLLTGPRCLGPVIYYCLQAIAENLQLPV